GFGAAGVGMVLGLIQYKLGERNLGDAGAEPVTEANAASGQKRKKNIATGLWVTGVLLLVLLILLFTGVVRIDPIVVARILGYVIPLSAVVYFIYVLIFQKLDRTERRHVLAIAIFFAATGLFYAGYEQQGSTLNLFAD